MQKNSIKGIKLEGLALPNLFVLLDIFSIAFSSVGTGSHFRALNKKCNAFYKTNKQYLQEQIASKFDLDQDTIPLLTSENIDDHALSVPHNLSILLMNISEDQNLSEEMILLKFFKIKINPKAIKNASPNVKAE